MKFVVLMTGEGEGCDFNIGCNKAFEVFEAEDASGAADYVQRILDRHAGGHPRIEKVELYAIEYVRSAKVSATCEECDRLGWPTKQPLHGVEGRTLCWTHAITQ